MVQHANIAKISNSRKWWAVVGVSLMTFIVWMDYSMVTNALPQIQHEFGSSVLGLEWVLNIFGLMLVVFMIVMGRLADLYGRRTIFYTGMFIFFVATVFAGFIPATKYLILSRAFEGLGGAMMIAAAAGLVTAPFADDKRGHVLGVWIAITTCGLAVGPILGGLIAGYLNWRWLFFIVAALTIIAFFICAFSVQGSDKDEGRLDWLGFFTFVVFIVCLVVALMQSSKWGWANPWTITLLVISFIFLLLFIFVESSNRDPIVNYTLFGNSIFFGAAIANFTTGFAVFTLLFLVPMYLHDMRGDALYIIALLQLPATALATVLSPLAGFLANRFGAKFFMVFGLLFLAVAIILQALFGASVSLWPIIVSFVCMGVGWGLAYAPAIVGALNSASHKKSASANGIQQTLFILGGVIGLSIVADIFNVADHTAMTFGLGSTNISAMPNKQQVADFLSVNPEGIKSVLENLTQTGREKLLAIFHTAFLHAYHLSMWTIFGVVVLGCLLVLVIARQSRRKILDTYAEVDYARIRIRKYVQMTPLIYNQHFSEKTGANVYFKLENLQTTGSYKLRGVYNKILSLPEDQQLSGIVIAGAGDRSLAAAFAAQQLDIKGYVIVPEGTSRKAIKILKQYNVHVEELGRTLADSRRHAAKFARDRYLVYIPDADDQAVVAGDGTIAVEIAEQLATPDVIFMPIGGGALVSGVGGYFKSIGAVTSIIGCQAQNAAAMTMSVKKGKAVDVEQYPTIATSLADPIEPESLTVGMCREVVDRFILVTEEEIKDALQQFINAEHMLIDGAAGVAIAAFLKHYEHYVGKNVVIVLTGANIDTDRLKTVVE